MITIGKKGNLINIFELRKADTFSRLLPYIMAVCVYTAIVYFIMITTLHLHDVPPFKSILTLHTLLGAIISLLMVFRTNTAYDRWWEGRKLWGGLVNNSRNLAVKMNAMLPRGNEKDRAFFKKIIPMFAHALYLHLRAETTRLELDSDPHPEIPDLDHTKHVPNQIASVMASKLNLMYNEGTLTGDQTIILNAEFQSFLDVCGACERIKNTPIPYSYSTFIKKFIFLYIMTLPFGLVFTLTYFSIPIVGIVFYVLASLEMIAEEIEDPFGTEFNDLPLEKIAENIKKNVEHILM
ncbi:hypothetical protein CJD36_004340 [Flavipsychrobacter stenotrophus]|uniref:Bestrophin n=1 Tax=Flavipsychrobacter stenotrophus TaxID=2077091 RepID=A0A2S7T198_9BACT|nr:bestrophin family protein [Flavipsychrobacter stenotrophus]PQJ12979.1 hypothetical protein CJD36_004340 [Flavipsychrobacter stenotrophus]